MGYPGMGGYGAPTVTVGSSANGIWMIVALVLAIVGGIVGYILFVAKKYDGKNKFLAWLHEFLNFKKFLLATILKVTYIILAIFVTLASFGTGSVLGFFLTLIFGNLLIRIIYEAGLMFITLVENSTEINKKLK